MCPRRRWDCGRSWWSPRHEVRVRDGGCCGPWPRRTRGRLCRWGPSSRRDCASASSWGRGSRIPHCRSGSSCSTFRRTRSECASGFAPGVLWERLEARKERESRDEDIVLPAWQSPRLREPKDREPVDVDLALRGVQLAVEVELLPVLAHECLPCVEHLRERGVKSGGLVLQQ